MPNKKVIMLRGFQRRFKVLSKKSLSENENKGNISKENKPLMSRYIRYSLGEIFLIVIGILIAWQINSISEKVKDRQKEKVYLIDLLDELKRDSLRIAANQSILTNIEGGARVVINYINSPPSAKADSLEFLNKVRSMIAVDVSLPNPIIWNELQSTGNLRLIRNRDLIEDLYVYYEKVRGCQHDFEANVKPFILKGRFFDSKTFSIEDQDDYFDNWRKDEVSSKKVFSELLTNEEFENIAKGIIAGAIVSRLSIDRLPQQISDLQKVIDSELDNK